MLSIFLLVAFIIFAIAAFITVPVWNRLIAAGLAFLSLGLGALSIVGVG